MTDDEEDILAQFSVEQSHDKTTLDRYLVAHPVLTADLLELALELELGVDNDTLLDLESATVVASWARFSTQGDA